MHLLHVRQPPEIRDIPQHLLIEDLHLVRFVSKEDSGHCVCCFVIAFKLIGTKLPFEVSKHVFDGRELGRMAWVIDHVEPILLNYLHYL